MTAAFPRITGIIWFDQSGSELWQVDSSPDSLAAYQGVVASPVWSSGTIWDEAELLTVAASSGQDSGGDRIVQASEYSGQEAAIFDGVAVGNYITYYVYVPAAGAYTVKLGTKLHSTRGIFQLAVAASVNGAYTNHGSPVDLYARSDTYTAVTVDADSVFGLKAFRFTITGKNASSTGYDFCADYIQLIPH
jgi:hypothetical protein